jgi:hypothetical protein
MQRHENSSDETKLPAWFNIIQSFPLPAPLHQELSSLWDQPTAPLFCDAILQQEMSAEAG